MNNLCRMKIILLAIVSVSVAACAVPGKYVKSKKLRDDCPKGSTYVDVKYGNSYLKVNPPIAIVKKGGAFEFRLDPKKGYEGKTVTVEGKTAGDNWIVKTSRAAGKASGKFSICVPANQPEGQYYYKVTVEDVGVLDPRADVT